MSVEIPKECSVLALMEEAFATRCPLALSDGPASTFVLPRVLGRCPLGLPMMVAEQLTPGLSAKAVPRYSSRLMVVRWPLVQGLARTSMAKLPHRSGTLIPSELLRGLSEIYCVN